MATRKGVQLVLLSRWNQKSVDRFLQAIAGYTGELEIGVAPFFANSRPFQYLNEIVANFRGRLKIAIHLSFHRDDPGANLRQIAVRMDQAWTQFIQSNQHKCDISVCPMLEDEFSSFATFAEYLKAAALQVPWELNPRLSFRRSYTGDPTVKPISFTYTSKQGKSRTISIGPHLPIKLETEVHGHISRGLSADVYSNDGNFVWFDNLRKVDLPFYETAVSFHNATPSDPVKYSLSHFTTTARAHCSVLLWRPAYNLYRPNLTVQPGVSGYLVKYSRTVGPGQATDGEVSFNEGGPRPKKIDLGHAFNDCEYAVLRYFLGLS